MGIHTKLRRPSKDPSVLADQLLRELENLEQEGESAEEPELYRAYLDYAQALAWEGVARGDLGAPRRILDHILAVQPLVATYEPAGGRPVERAALEVGGLIRSLYTACEAVADKQVEVRLSDRRSATEREVLRVLAASQDEYLRRVDVYERLDPKRRPTPARVGQILAELHHDELLKRIHGRAQGNPNASFYALSPRGIEVCRDLGLSPAPAPGPTANWIYRFVQIVLDSDQSTHYRRIAVGSLANCQSSGEQVLDILEAAAIEKGEETFDFFKEAFTQIVLTKAKIAAVTDSADSGIVHLDQLNLHGCGPELVFAQYIVAMAARNSTLPTLQKAREEAAVEALRRGYATGPPPASTTEGKLIDASQRFTNP
ncbi:MAG TPA: hypothetical protein VHC97_25580 [Thermoanaerobaculia bacterium]|jgi:hypothetical protein|nr:hypothetical protein [Thermoanaerobaculia bacterium]